MNYQHVIFDMDGTLFSSEPMIWHTYKRGIDAFNEKHNNNLPVPTLDEILCLLGFPIKEIYNHLFPYSSEEVKNEIQDLITIELIKAINNKEGEIFSGVDTIIPELHKKGAKLYIASNGQEIYLSSILKTYGLFSLFHPIVTLNYKDILTKGDILKVYKEKYNLDPKATVMIGDRDSDWDASKAIQCDFIACRFGHGEASEVEKADNQAYKFEEILKYIY